MSCFYQYDSNGNLTKETTTQLDYATGQILATDPETGLPIQPQIKGYKNNGDNYLYGIIFEEE